MENFYNSLQQQIEFIKIDGLILSAQQMRDIKNDKTIIVNWQGEWMHLCRCEPISNLDVFRIARKYKINHVALNGKTICGRITDKYWYIEKTTNWENRCKSCESIINKES